MAKKSSVLAALDIESEGLHQQDGLAERLARQRAERPAARTAQPVAPRPPAVGGTTEGTYRSADPNAWRRGKSPIQITVDEDAHVELSIIAKRRRLTLNRLVKEAIDQWLEAHGHALRVGDT